MNQFTSREAEVDVMNFLNEISYRYPEAISFASGRPTDKHFNIQRWLESAAKFIEHFSVKQGISYQRAEQLISQYGKTNGVVNELIAEQVRKDQGINCCDKDIIITNGCQEAMALCLLSLCREPDDVLLVCNPTYIGITGLADVLDIEVCSVDYHHEAQLLQTLGVKIEALIADKKRPRAFYLMPDFDNPSGLQLSLQARQQILELCSKYDVAILEDNPYGLFQYNGEPKPALYQLDESGCVIYLGTYAKTLCPAIRIGYLILPPHFLGDVQRQQALSDKLSSLKSYLSVNTSQITQAILGGVLLDNQCSVESLVVQPRKTYLDNRDTLVTALERFFADYRDQVSWNIPAGGFFLKLTLPFKFNSQDVAQCAQHHQVICMPMSYFAQDNQFDNCVRLAFSNLDRDQIVLGVERLSRYIIEKLAAQKQRIDRQERA